ncbi:MAG: YdcF family protein [Actinomycetota bacterium]
MRKLLRSLVLVLVLALAYPAWLGYRVWEQSHHDELRGADAIVVLGAAQYDGEPSPVFKARLDHAAYLYKEQLSGMVIVTGGKRPGDRFSEGEAGAAYLEGLEIDAADILHESSGRTTLQSLQGVRAIAQENEVDSVLLVSDPLHSERIKRIATDLGFEHAYASPASYVVLNRSRATKARELVHEIVSLMAYELLQR